MNDAERRNMWTDRIERCLASGMTIKEWCRLNHVCPSSLYKWMARFREEEPGRFPRRSSVAANWIEITRGGIADSRAIVPADTQNRELEAARTGLCRSDAKTRCNTGCEPHGRNFDSSAAQPIRALVGYIELAIPPGSAECDIASAMRAAATL